MAWIDSLFRGWSPGDRQQPDRATIKPFVIARKNFLFAATVDGAKALCMHLGFIRTAKYHGLDPYHYYVKLLKRISYCKSVGDYEKLLPWNIQLGYLKNTST